MISEAEAVSKEEDCVPTMVETGQLHRTPSRSAPDGGWGWMCVLGASIIFLFYGATIKTFGVTYLLLLSQYNQSATATAWVGAINFALTGFLGE